ncbi:MAG: hypothetical protein FJX63_01045 [Alphaproteobacteria bacterium]|nr:hypothetical protein [Alphaproteobacteria bacterium]
MYRSFYGLAVAGVLAIGAVHLGLAFVIGQAVADRLIAREAELLEDLVATIVNAEGGAEAVLAAPAPSPLLAALTREPDLRTATIRANIYSPDGFIRASSDANLVGLQFTDNDELAESLAGHTIAKLESLGGKDEQIALKHFDRGEVIEVYVPIAHGGKTAAVVEFYRRPEPVLTAVAESRAAIAVAGVLSA